MSTSITQGSGVSTPIAPSNVADQATAPMSAVTPAQVGNMPATMRDHLIGLINQLIDLLGRGRPQPVPKPLPLNKQQDRNLRAHFGLDKTMSYQVVDSNRDGKLSAGDTLYITGPTVKRAPIKLTQADVDAINGKKPANDALQQLEKNRKLWESQGIDDYSFTLQRSCFCRGDDRRPIHIQVRDGKVVAAKFADTGEPLPPSMDYAKKTIPDLFNEVAQAIKEKAARLEVSYDPTYGFPTSIFIDRSELIADEEIGYSVSNFQPEPIFTTMACGEEGNDCGLPPAPPVIEPPPIITTMALGEEGGDTQGWSIGSSGATSATGE